MERILVGNSRISKPEAPGTGPPGFEPGFEAPEASVISKLYYGPTPDASAERRPLLRFGACRRSSASLS
jgi:hypothetical protein